MSERRVCEQCGEAFIPAKPWARYCSDNCRLRAHRELRRREDPNAAVILSMQRALGVLRAEGDPREALAAVVAAIAEHPSSTPAPTKSTKASVVVSIDDDALRRRLRAAREAGHAQRDVAVALGFSDGSTLSRWEKAKGKLTEERARALARYLDDAGIR